MPALIGSLLIDEDTYAPYTLLARWCAGFVAMMGIAYIPSALGIFMKMSLGSLSVIYMILVTAAAAGGAVKLVKTGSRPLKRIAESIRGANFFEFLALALPAAHAVVTFLMMHIDDDDVAYVAAVTTSVDTNTLMKYDAVTGNLITDFATNGMDRLVSSPQFAFYAVISRVFGIRPAPLCHTFLPPVLTMLFFCAFLLVGRAIFKDDRKKIGLFGVFVFLINMSSYFSVYTAGTFLMIRSWQGKAQIVGLILPLILSFFLTVMDKGDMGVRDILYLVSLLAAACLMTSMGAVLAAGMAAALALTAAVILRKGSIVLRSVPAFIIPVVMLVIYMTI